MNNSNRATREVYVYDKAKYHEPTTEKYGLPVEHTYHHTTFFLAWIIRHNMLSDFISDGMIEKYKSGQCSINEIYEWWDTCFLSDMLNEEGRGFAAAYFDFNRGRYIYDYIKHLKKDLPSEFHVKYSPENEKIIHAVIDKRYSDWKVGKLGAYKAPLSAKRIILASVLLLIIFAFCWFVFTH